MKVSLVSILSLAVSADALLTNPVNQQVKVTT
jgi:hypothetical protein